jgi:hypothetical protein
MPPIPTESRTFANHYFRDVRRLEALHAGLAAIPAGASPTGIGVQSMS